MERHESQVDRARGRVNEARQRLKHPVRAGIDLHDETCHLAVLAG